MGISAHREMEIAVVAQAAVVVAAIEHDNNGSMVGGQWMGGNGGLLSRETIVEADKLRRALSSLKAAERADHA